MSRITHPLSNENTKIVVGDDHACGKFVDVYDERQVPHCNHSGEGFMFQYSELLGVEINLIGMEPGEYLKPEIILEKTNAYFNKNKQ